MLGTTIAACPGHDRISQRDDYRIADKRDVPSQPIPQATRSSEFIWDRSLSRDTLNFLALFAKCIDGGDPGGNAVIRLQWNRRKSATSAGGQYELRIEPFFSGNRVGVL